MELTWKLARRFGIAIVCALGVKYSLPVVEPAVLEYLGINEPKIERVAPVQYRFEDHLERIEDILEGGRYVR